MISVLFLCSVLWLGLVLDEEFSLSRGDLLVRLAAAVVLGCFWSTWLVYLLSLWFGFQIWTVIGATGLIVLFNSIAWKKRGRDLAWLSSLPPVDRRFWGAFSIFPVLVAASFIFGVWRSQDGDILFRGNFTDLAFHMGTVSAFLEQESFPPLNPQSAAAKLSYHFMTDFFSAILCRGGFSLFYGLKIPMVLFAFSLGTLTCHFFRSVLKARTAALCACILFLFGHIGVFNYLFGLAGYPVGNEPFSFKAWSSIKDHLTFPYFNFLNVLVDFFQPQLPFLFGFPFAVLVLLTLHRRFLQQERTNKTAWFVLALVAFLPLFHMHTFLVLAPLVGLALVFGELTPAQSPQSPGFGPAPAPPLPTTSTRPAGAFRTGSSPGRALRNLLGRCARIPARPIIPILALGLAGIVIAPQFAFILSQKKVPGFSGFDVSAHLGSMPEIPDLFHCKRLWFWIRVAGMPLILGSVGFFALLGSRFWRKGPERRAEAALAAFFALGVMYFVLINFYRMTPNWGDSNKLFLYWNLGLCVYAGRLLSRMWDGSRLSKTAVAVLLLLGAILPSGFEWGVRYAREPVVLFSSGDQITADWIRLNTPRDAVFLTANSLAHYVPALAGRRVVNGAYTRETGFAGDAIEESVARAFREANPALISTVRVTHVVVGPDEKLLYRVSRGAMARWHKLLFDQTCRGLRFSVYEVRPIPPKELAEERAREKASEFVWLSSMDPSFVRQFGVLKYDESFAAETLTLDGKTYPRGLGTHAPSEIRFRLGGAYSLFESDIGVDDSQLGGAGSVVFEVWVDERMAYRSKILNSGDIPESVRIDVSGAAVLKLIVTDAGDGNHCDHADWAGARLLRRK